jgi:hypothetical protein
MLTASRDEMGVSAMAGVIEPAAVLNFREEARQCLHLASAEPESELRTILEGMARGWLMMADCAWVSQEPEISPVELTAQDYAVRHLRRSGPKLFGLLQDSEQRSKHDGSVDSDGKAAQLLGTLSV